NIPVTVAVVDGFDGHTVGVGEVFVEVGGAMERLERGGVVAVLIVFRDRRGGQVIVSGGGAGARMLAPVAVWRLLLRGETVHHLGRQPLPILVAENFAGDVYGPRPDRHVIRRRADERRLIQRIILALGSIGGDFGDQRSQQAPPALSAIVAQF